VPRCRVIIEPANFAGFRPFCERPLIGQKVSEIRASFTFTDSLAGVNRTRRVCFK
jgi:hypothetical protein